MAETITGRERVLDREETLRETGRCIVSVLGEQVIHTFNRGETVEGLLRHLSLPGETRVLRDGATLAAPQDLLVDESAYVMLPNQRHG